MDKESVDFCEKNRTLIARISCEIDHHLAKGLRERIDRELFMAKPDTLVLDFSGVGFMDSSALALIIGRAQTALALSCDVKLAGLSLSGRKLVYLSGVDKLENVKLLDGEY